MDKEDVCVCVCVCVCVYEYYSAIKKWKNTICSNMGEPGDFILLLLLLQLSRISRVQLCATP